MPCGEDYDAAAVESDHAVVVFVIVHDYAGPLPSYSIRPGGTVPVGVVCQTPAYSRDVPVHLVRPLGDRAVLEDFHGVVLPLSPPMPLPPAP